MTGASWRRLAFIVRARESSERGGARLLGGRVSRRSRCQWRRAKRACVPVGPAAPIDSCAAAWTSMTGNLARIISRNTLMNSVTESALQKIEAREIPEGERLQVLPRHFGRHMLTVEYAVYAFMRKLSRDYTGGY